MSALVFDVESYPIDGAAAYLEPATAPANYVKPEAIASYIEKANAEQLAKAALDVDLARIVAIGWSYEGKTVVATCRDEAAEHAALSAFWALARPAYVPYRGNERPEPNKLIGFNCIGWDLPLLLRRSLYLGVKAPKLPINKYRHDGIEDMMLSLSFDGALRYRSLGFYAKRFKLDVPADMHTGADIGALVAAGDYEAVAAHCRCDIETTVALARRIGVL